MSCTLSVITTVFNGGATIRDCLESVRRQWHSVEHIVIDGSSTDNTMEIVDEYAADLATVISEPDSGVYEGMNKGLRLATGDVVGFLNADDLYAHPAVLSRVARLFANKNVDACYSDLVYVRPHASDQVVRYWRSGPYMPGKFLWGWMPPHPTFFARRRIYEQYGGFRLDLGSAADYELMLRLLVKYKISAEYFPEIMVKMRTGGLSGSSLMHRLRANRYDRLAWQLNGLDPFPWTLLLKPIRKMGQYVKRPADWGPRMPVAVSKT